jgi:CBS domain containing-hemolysin-like protein
MKLFAGPWKRRETGNMLSLRRMKLPDLTHPPVPAEKRARFLGGVVLIAFSFLVYPAFIVILLLPLSAEMKIAVIAAASIASWAAFSAGIYLAGRRGYNWLKERWRQLMGIKVEKKSS